jgi:hypothetical protein
MMKMRMLLLGLLIALAALLSILGHDDAARRTAVSFAHPAAAEDPVYQIAHLQPITPTGILAIKPVNSASVPSFPTASVINYIRQSPTIRSVIASPNRIVVSVKAAGALPSLIGTSTGLPPDYRVVYADITGRIVAPDAPASSTIGRLPTYTHGFAIFDAKTGNLLMDGGLRH